MVGGGVCFKATSCSNRNRILQAYVQYAWDFSASSTAYYPLGTSSSFREMTKMGQRHSSQSYHICKGCIFFILPCQHSIMNLQQYILLPWDSLTFCNKLSPLSAADVSAHSLVTLSYVDKLLQQITGVWASCYDNLLRPLSHFSCPPRLSENFPSVFFSWSVSCLREKSYTIPE